MKGAICTPIVIIGLALLSGCATTPTAEELSRIGYGTSLTVDWQSAIKSWFHDQLKDPFTAQYEFTQPRQGYTHTPPIDGAKLLVGYKVIAKVNSKNSFGAYAGFTPYLFIFRNNAIVYVFGPTMAETEYALEGR
jgi:hypothetical protein